MDNAKPCGGAIPVCMVEEFNLPSSIIDRKVILNHPSLSEIRNKGKKSETYLPQNSGPQDETDLTHQP